MPEAPEILVGVGASIAAYKACDVVSALRKRGAGVTVLLTRNAPRFVAPLALATLSGRPVGLDLFDEPAAWGVGHITLAKRARAFVIVGATADLIARLAAGMADDFVTTCALATRAPLLIAPAMNTAMWRHPSVQANLRVLKERGARVLDPESGLLACGDVGDGKLVDPGLIAQAAWDLALGRSGDGGPGGPARAALPLAGKRILVSAGPTREALDPVRFLSNASSGKMGYALAEACRDLGAAVTLVSGPVSLAAPAGVDLVRVESAEAMLKACTKAFAACHAFVACAAVADFRPLAAAPQKVKKSGAQRLLRLAPNPDILLTLSKSKGKRILVGFAAETEALLANAKKKLAAKRLDLLVANPVDHGRGMGADDNEAWLLRPGGRPEHLPLQSKNALAGRLARELAGLLGSKA